jgi:hypothetical protein
LVLSNQLAHYTNIDDQLHDQVAAPNYN